MRKQVCSKCYTPLEYRPHRRTSLCDECYEEKRRNDVMISVRKFRGSEEPTKKFNRINKDLDECLKELFFLGYEAIDVIYDNHLNGYIQFSSKIQFPLMPNNFMFSWKLGGTKNSTKLYFRNDHSSPTKYLELMRMDLNEWIKSLKTFEN